MRSNIYKRDFFTFYNEKFVKKIKYKIICSQAYITNTFI